MSVFCPECRCEITDECAEAVWRTHGEHDVEDAICALRDAISGEDGKQPWEPPPTDDYRHGIMDAVNILDNVLGTGIGAHMNPVGSVLIGRDEL